MAAPKKGNHVFNNAKNLFAEMSDALNQAIGSLASGPERETFLKQLAELADMCQRYEVSRENADFNTTDHPGDPANSSRFSTFATAMVKAVKQMLTKSASVSTQGYTEFNRRLDHLEEFVVDAVAARAVRDGLRAEAQKRAFDTWRQATLGLLYRLLVGVRDLALEVHKA